jgi:hypothetical protein
MMKEIARLRKSEKQTFGSASVVLLSVFCFLLLSGCTSPKNDKNPVTQPDIVLGVEAQPQAILADGTSHLVVFIEMRSGQAAVSDSTEIILLNTIGSLGSGIVYTHAGVALDTLTSDTTAAVGWLIAYSQGVRDSVEITFTARN